MFLWDCVLIGFVCVEVCGVVVLAIMNLTDQSSYELILSFSECNIRTILTFVSNTQL